MFGILRPGSPDRSSTTPDESSPPPMSMAGPPPGQFPSREEMLMFMKDWAEHQGYAIVIGRSRLNRLWLKCDRGGVYTDRHGLTPENRKRKRGETRLTDCPFKVLANVRKDGIWRCHTENSDHNHSPSEDLSVHPSLRRMTDEQVQKVNEMTEAGNSPAETLDELQRLWPGIKVLRRDIYNARKKYKTEKELAEMAQGFHEPQPYEDPNGKMAGPTRTGRWEWLEEGDEIKRKKKTKISQLAQQSLHPELRDVNATRIFQLPTRRQAAGLGSLPPKPFQPAQSVPAEQQRVQATQQAQQVGDYDRISLQSPTLTQSHDQSPSQSRLGHRYHTKSKNPDVSQGSNPAGYVGNLESASVGSVNAGVTATSNGVSGASKAPSGQVLMSRIERMEKEQRDQKNMLAKILGAVQGIQGGTE